MEEMDPDAGRVGDGDGFADGVRILAVDGADVAGVEAAAGRRLAGQGDELAGVHVDVRGVAQPACDAERPLAHGLPNRRAHAVELGRGGAAVVVAHHVGPKTAGAEIRREIGRRASSLQGIEEAAERGPARGPVQERVGLPAASDRSHRLRLAEDLGGDALQAERRSMSVAKAIVFGVAVEIEEPRRHHHPGGTDLAPSSAAHLAHGRDPVADDGQVTGYAGSTGPVDDGGPANHHVVVGSSAPGQDAEHHHWHYQPWHRRLLSAFGTDRDRASMRTAQMTRSLPPSRGIWAPVVRENVGPASATTARATSSDVSSTPSTLLVRYCSGVMP